MILSNDDRNKQSRATFSCVHCGGPLFFFFPIFGGLCVDAFSILASFDEADDKNIKTDVGVVIDLDGRLSTGIEVERGLRFRDQDPSHKERS